MNKYLDVANRYMIGSNVYVQTDPKSNGLRKIEGIQQVFTYVYDDEHEERIRYDSASSKYIAYLLENLPTPPALEEFYENVRILKVAGGYLSRTDVYRLEISGKYPFLLSLRRRVCNPIVIISPYNGEGEEKAWKEIYAYVSTLRQ